MYLSHLRMLNIDLLNNDPYLVPEQACIIIMGNRSSICMDNNDKDVENTRHIAIIMHFLINGEDWNLHKTVCCERGLKLAYIVTNNVREDQLNPILGYAMVRLDHRIQKSIKNNVLSMTLLDWFNDLNQCVWNVHISL